MCRNALIEELFAFGKCKKTAIIIPELHSEMVNSKAIKVLRTFSADELRQFGKFVSSPFHNNNKKLTRLFLYLRKKAPDYIISKEKVYLYLYPDKKYSDDVIRHLFAELYRLCEEFLIHSALDSDYFTKKLFLLNKLGDKSLDNLFLKCHNKLELESQSYKTGSMIYKIKGDLKNILIVFSLLRNRQHRVAAHTMKRSEYYLNYILSLLDYQVSDIYTDRLNYGRLKEPYVIDAFVENINLKGFSDWLNDNMKDEYFFLSICCNLILLKQHALEERFYHRAKKIIFERFESLADEEKQYTIDSLINYCNYELKFHFNHKYIREVFELNQKIIPFHVSRGYALRNIEYLDTLNSAFELGELNWADDFIVNYTKYTEDPENMRNYAYAILCFYKCKYDESLEYSNKVKLNDPSIKTDFRFFLMKLYYELNFVEQGIYLINSLRQFVANSKDMSEILKKSLNEKIKICEKLFNLRLDKEHLNKYSLQEIKKIIDNSSFIGKKWYFEKAAELEIISK